MCPSKIVELSSKKFPGIVCIGKLPSHFSYLVPNHIPEHNNRSAIKTHCVLANILAILRQYWLLLGIHHRYYVGIFRPFFNVECSQTWQHDYCPPLQFTSHEEEGANAKKICVCIFLGSRPFFPVLFPAWRCQKKSAGILTLRYSSFF